MVVLAGIVHMQRYCNPTERWHERYYPLPCAFVYETVKSHVYPLINRETSVEK